jgi:hypothetical protein
LFTGTVPLKGGLERAGGGGRRGGGGGGGGGNHAEHQAVVLVYWEHITINPRGGLGHVCGKKKRDDVKKYIHMVGPRTRKQEMDIHVERNAKRKRLRKNELGKE